MLRVLITPIDDDEDCVGDIAYELINTHEQVDKTDVMETQIHYQITLPDGNRPTDLDGFSLAARHDSIASAQDEIYNNHINRSREQRWEIRKVVTGYRVEIGYCWEYKMPF